MELETGVINMHSSDDQIASIAKNCDCPVMEKSNHKRTIYPNAKETSTIAHRMRHRTLQKFRTIPFLSAFVITTLLFGYPANGQDLLDTTIKPRLGLYPSMVNLAAQAEITTNATCGDEGPERFCKLVEHVQRLSRRRRRRKRSQCDVCSSSIQDLSQRHDIEYAIDGKGRWWQSPSINNGYEYHWVTITLDLKQVFQVAYFILKAANSPRPGNWILEKSLDGVAWEPWQYFAVSDNECRKRYPARVARMGSPRLQYDSEVVCMSYFSQLLPLQNGEIHLSLINGRPTAKNPSDELIKFTSARYVRLRFQKIRTLFADLMTIAKRQSDQIDPSVTQRYFYSVKDISIGGMCICYGHAHDCPEDPLDGNFLCKCEHNTMGDNCEQCLPMYNQYKWSPGSGGFECEECNCHGHANSCYYDENVERRKESLNIHGARKGGGVCIGCQDFTAGVNCDSCVDGFYRGINVSPSDAHPCQPCDCVAVGTRTTFDGKRMCKKSVNDGGALRGMLPGDCYCKEGYVGPKCDRCDFGYQNYPTCEPCPCNVDGSLNEDPCFGECICKENVAGTNCERCKVGYFNLDRHSEVGCEECYCSGVVVACDSARLFRDSLRSLEGWVVADRAGSHIIEPLYDEDSDEPYVAHENTSTAVCTGLYYWVAPSEFLGNKLSSYGGELRYTIYYELPMSSPQPLTFRDVDVILEGNGIALELILDQDVPPYVSTPFVARLKEGAGWLEANSLLPASKNQIVQALSDVSRLLIRASHNRNGNSVFRIRDLSMDIATSSGEGEPVLSVEQCYCPPGYAGLSCEDCAPGYHRNGRECLACECNGHSDKCNVFTGVCERCQDGTAGMYCEICLPGYHGDATRGGCTRCACPRTEESNNFSPTCIFDDLDNAMVCLNCPPGYDGLQCERCSPGYFGNPTVLGDVCKRCECNGNSITCDRVTGVCNSCQGNTAGPYCQHCATGFYGDAVVRKDCSHCSCDPDGSFASRCDPVTGQCPCRPGLYGRRCDFCSDDEYLDRDRKACVPCLCNERGTDGYGCGPTGQCPCKEGVSGKNCDRCSTGYYDFGESGCKECNCPHTNDHCDAVTGACVCPPLTTGEGCSQCVPNSYGWNPDMGCQDCNCHDDGSKSAQCDVGTGDCRCKEEYSGKQCNQCREGFYDFPNCLPCVCHIPGTELTSCTEDYESCVCSNAGQCQCKENVVGVKCNRCAEGTFSLQPDNPKGCTDCFCFGITDQCTQAEYHWGNTVSLSLTSPVAVANQINTRSTTEGVLLSKDEGMVTMDPAVVKRSLRYEPYYWRLPSQFIGDKLSSYGGRLRFTVFYSATFDSSPHADAPTIVIRGKYNGTTIAYNLEEPKNRESKSYTVAMREAGWTYLDSDTPVTRGDFTMALHNIEYFLIKASYGRLIDQSRLSDVFLDVAVEGSGGGRGDSTSNAETAWGIEICECPPGYSGLSCQECDIGYTRIRTGRYLGECRPCACHGKSDVCDVNTGVCLGCRDNFEGDRCDRCKPGFYATPGPTGPVCSKCACPLPTPENNFSPTCRPTASGSYICNQCPTGYEGPHCERCSYGYYGDPTTPGGFCRRCGCNPTGSLSTACDSVTGQCVCIPGVTGKVCDQCKPHHAITEEGCIKCDDECSGKLLNEVEALIKTTRAIDLEDIFPPPWDRLMRLENRSGEVEPYLRILMHRKRNFEAARCLRIQIFMDTAMTDIMDTLMVVLKVSPVVNGMNMTIELAIEKSNMFNLDSGNLAYEANRTHGKLERRIKSFENMLEENRIFANRMEKLLERLQEDIDIDEAAIVAGIAKMITKLGNRNMSVYQEIADEELRLANDFLSDVHDEFTTAARRVKNRVERNRKKIASLTAEVHLKLNDILQKGLEADGMAREAKKLNKLNVIAMRQLKADIEKLNNEIAMVEAAKMDAFNVVNDTEFKMEEIRLYIEQLRMQGEKLKELLKELKRESDMIASARADFDTLGARVKQAREHEMQLVKDAKYYQDVYRNLSDISMKQTDAATRFSRIADLIANANATAHRALQIAMDNMRMDKGNWTEMADSSLIKGVDLLNEVKDFQDNITGLYAENENISRQTSFLTVTAQALSERLDKVDREIDNLDLEPPANLPLTVETNSVAENITDDVMSQANQLKSDVKSLEEAVETTSKYTEISKEIKDNLKDIPNTLTRIENIANEALVKKVRFDLKSRQVQNKIEELRKRISESRMKAASIQKASVKSEGKCTMRYLPPVTSGRVTEVTLTVMPETPDNTLFYMGRDEGDFVLITTVDGKVRVSWDLGSGVGEVINPLNVVKDKNVREDWYEIELYRLDQQMTVTVFRHLNKTGTLNTVSQTSPGESVILDVEDRDHLFIGAVDKNVKLPKEVPARSFTGCMGEAYLQGKRFGLWNFREVSDPSDCDGCMAVPDNLESATVVYGYNGDSYTLLQYSMNRQSETLVTFLDVEFKTLSSNGILLYIGSSIATDFIFMEFVDGRIVARIDIGNGVTTIQSKKQYNIGKWCSVHLRRYKGEVVLTAKHPDGDEKAKIDIIGSDEHFNVSSNDLMCIGGCPTDHVLNTTMQKNGFIGCIKNFRIFYTIQPLVGTSHVLRYSGVETKCPEKVSRDIGIDDGGFVELPGHALPVTGSVSITFNSRESDALLLLATDGIASRRRRRRRRQSDTNFYSLSLSGGHIEARLRAVSGSPLILRSTNGIYSDGDEHTVLLRRQGNLIQLIIDDNIEGLVSGKLVRGDKLELSTSRLFVGGLPDSMRIKDMAGSGASINGCVRELITGGLVDFKNATKVRNSYVGSCAYTPTFPLPYTTTTTTTAASTTRTSTSTTTPRTTRPTIRSTTPQVIPSAIQVITTPSMVTTTQLTTPVTTDTTGCAAEGELPTLKGSTVHFGRNAHSHMEFAFEEDISTKFRVQIEFRTVAAHGLLLYAASDDYDDFFSLQLKNGMPVFLFDSGKGPGEAIGNSSLNDGKWHTIRISRSKRKGFLKVDNMRYAMAKSPKGTNRMDVAKVLYVGGIKSGLDVRRLSGMWQSLDACVRSVTLNKAKLDLRKPDMAHDTTQCYENIEEGAYFDGVGYVIYDDVFRVGPEMTIEFEFRTWTRDAVLVSVSDHSRSDGLALELANGTFIFRVNNGAGDIVAEYTPRVGPRGSELCDGMWHKVKAEKQRYLLTLTVDGNFRTNSETSMGDPNSADTEDPLYIGGLPDDATPQRQLSTRTKFQGCIRRMMLKGQTVDFSRVYEYRDIYPNSCPKSSNGS